MVEQQPPVEQEEQHEKPFEQEVYDRLSQADYQPTPYEDSSYSVVGERIDTDDFIPFEAQVVTQLVDKTDPMFADYGGLDEIGGERRWHLPENLASDLQRSLEEPEEAVPTVTLQEEELEQRLRDAFEQGRVEGEQQAMQEADTKMAKASEQMLSFFEELQEKIQCSLMVIEREAVRLSVDVAEEIVGGCVEINPEYLLPLINEGLNLSEGSTILRIRVSPQDHEFLTYMGVAEKLSDGKGTWEFEVDPEVASGCVVETTAGIISLEVDKAFGRVRDEVLRVVPS